MVRSRKSPWLQPHARLCFVDRDFDPHDLASSLPRKKKAFAEQEFPQPGVYPSTKLSTNLVHLS